MKGRVIKSTGSWYTISTTDGEIVSGRLRGKFKNLELKVTNPIAVGDEVVGEPDIDGGDTYVIQEILPRKNHLIRRSSRNAHNAHIIAANIDQAIIVVSLKSPKTSFGFVDRFLVATESFRIPTVLIFNKTDLLKKRQLEQLEYFEDMYREAGYDSLRSSLLNEEGIDEIKKLVAGKTTLVAGHSGVGKSSLLNALSPKLDLKTSPISKYTDKGVHTTTAVEMYEVDKNSFVIDSPGLRELGFYDISKAELPHFIPEIRALLGQCQFNDCSHVHEPNCAVLDAVENEEISESRYFSYVKILEELTE